MTLIDIIQAIQELQPSFKIDINVLTDYINTKLNQNKFEDIEKMGIIDRNPELKDIKDYFTANELRQLICFQKGETSDISNHFIETVLMRKLNVLDIVFGEKKDKFYIHQIIEKYNDNDVNDEPNQTILFEYIPDDVKKVKKSFLTEWITKTIKSNITYTMNKKK